MGRKAVAVSDLPPAAPPEEDIDITALSAEQLLAYLEGRIADEDGEVDDMDAAHMALHGHTLARASRAQEAVDALDRTVAQMGTATAEGLRRVGVRQDRMARHLSTGQITTLVLAIIGGIGSVAFGLWINSRPRADHTVAVPLTAALGIFFIAIVVGWFKEAQDVPADEGAPAPARRRHWWNRRGSAEAPAPAPQRDPGAPPTERVAVVRMPPPSPAAPAATPRP